MDDINEQTDSMKQIQDALSVPIGAAADFDDVGAFLYHYKISFLWNNNMIFFVDNMYRMSWNLNLQNYQKWNLPMIF